MGHHMVQLQPLGRHQAGGVGTGPAAGQYLKPDLLLVAGLLLSECWLTAETVFQDARHANCCLTLLSLPLSRLLRFERPGAGGAIMEHATAALNSAAEALRALDNLQRERRRGRRAVHQLLLIVPRPVRLTLSLSQTILLA